ncbi:MAG TPA: hypothetical protein VM713_10280, partial [Steroidobacteraceae bacterium]|nr:hypothetical protein [Steroidobacteraceae bacterium]
MRLSSYRALVVFLLGCGIAVAATGPKEAAPATGVATPAASAAEPPGTALVLEINGPIGPATSR